MDWNETAQSVDDWIALGRRHQNGARALLKAKLYSLAWDHTGFAVECFLKAAIMRREGMNRWPEAHERKELWSHECGPLIDILDIRLDSLAKLPVGPRLQVLLNWRRRHGYNPNALPEKYAEQIYQAAFSSEGVVEWIAKTFQLPF